MQLADVLNNSQTEAALVVDCVALIESEVANKGGLRGAAVRAGYKAMKKLQPGIVAKAVKKLMPAFAPALQPHYDEAVASGDVRSHFSAHASDIAESLLSVTDEKAKSAKNGVMRKVYSGLRGQAQMHTATAMPGLADVLAKHL